MSVKQETAPAPTEPHGRLGVRGSSRDPVWALPRDLELALKADVSSRHIRVMGGGAGITRLRDPLLGQRPGRTNALRRVSPVQHEGVSFGVVEERHVAYAAVMLAGELQPARLKFAFYL